jgi:hypothetical protein
VRRTARELNRATLARQLLLERALADREPEVYRRYHHWWDKLPDGQTRLLPGP